MAGSEQQTKWVESVAVGDQPPAARSRAFAGVGLASGLGAVAAKSCCLLPLALASSGLGGAWLSQELIAYQPYFLGVAWVAIAVAWLFAIRRRCPASAPGEACEARSRGKGIALLALSTVIVGLATIWERIDPTLAQAFLEGGL